MNRKILCILALPLAASAANMRTGEQSGATGASVVKSTASGPLPVAATIAQTSAPASKSTALKPTMTFGTTSNFSHGWNISALSAAKGIGATVLRDGISWSEVEAKRGTYDFSSSRVIYVDHMIEEGIQPILHFSGGNANYDGGYTPYTDEGRNAFAAFIVATLKRFPRVQMIELGNEFNSNDFVTGPVKAAGYGQRQLYYYLLLKAVHDAVKSARPDVRILGGAAHSIPIGYLKVLFSQGALNLMDAVVIHPYTTDPEQFNKQIDLLRSAMGNRNLPIYVTEYALESDSTVDTANYLLKMTTAMASAAIAGADWFELQQEGPVANPWYKNAGLTDRNGLPTVAGRAFKLLSLDLLPRGTPERLITDEFTYAYSFGRNAIVIWGFPRAVRFRGNARFYDATGQSISAPAKIDPGKPLVIISDAPIVLGSNLLLGTSSLIADSYDQFDYTNDPSGPNRFEGPWSYFTYSSAKGSMQPLYTQFGGEVSSSNWTPYIGSDWLRPFSISAKNVSPADFGSAGSPNIYKAVIRYTAPVSQTVMVKGSFGVASNTTDGVDITIQQNGNAIYAKVVKDVHSVTLRQVRLAKGDTIDVIIGPNGSAVGDSTDYRVQISKP